MEWSGSPDEEPDPSRGDDRAEEGTWGHVLGEEEDAEGEGEDRARAAYVHTHAGSAAKFNGSRFNG